MGILTLALALTTMLAISTSCEKEELTAGKLLTGQLDSFLFDTLYRSFYVHLPKGYTDLTTCPLLVAIHGFSSSATDFQTQTGWNEKADEEGFIVVYPNGLRYPWDARNPRAWNCGEPWAGATGYTDDTGFINELIDRVCRDFRIDENRIYATGHSNGSRMACRLGVELSCRLAAVAAHSGQLVYLEEPGNVCPVSLLHLHSKDDGSVNPNGYYTQNNTYILPVDSTLSIWASRIGCNTQFVTIRDDEGLQVKQWLCPGTNTEILYYLTDSGDHQWFTPGNSAISATEVIWEFLQGKTKS